MFPWIHLYTEPDGKTFPCCNTIRHDAIKETTSKKTLFEIFNSDTWKNLRLDMLQGNANKMCNRCHEVEEIGNTSYRNFANNDFGDFIDIIDETNEDGSLDAFQLKYIDVRWSNQCNFACAPCGPVFSTKWIQMKKNMSASDAGLFSYNKVTTDSIEDMLLQLEPHLKNCHQIYFAGGEPLIIDDHYRLLELLEEKNIFDVRLRYNTNMSTLNYKKRSAIDYWSSFKDIEICASIDGIGKRGEIIRYGTNWDIIEQNLKTVLPYENITLNYSATITNLNVDHLTDMYDYIFEKGLLKRSSWFATSIAFDPYGFSITNLPKHIKSQISTKILKWVDDLPNRDFNYDLKPVLIEDLQKRLTGVVKFMEKSDNWSFDALKNTLSGSMLNNDWQEIPHLKQIYNEYNINITDKQ